MDTVTCMHCNGSGKEVAMVDLTTGQATYRVCAVCSGSGKVAVEKSYFTQYPDKSLEFAKQLMQEHGKPSEICIAGNHDIQVLFPDGAKFTLGGFTVGYLGTGPRYTKAFLDAAGFTVSMDDIVSMHPPVTLIAGQPYEKKSDS